MSVPRDNTQSQRRKTDRTPAADGSAPYRLHTNESPCLEGTRKSGHEDKFFINSELQIA